MYTPTIYDWSMFLGTIGLFLCLLFLFVRYLPMISIFEMRTMLPAAHVAGQVAEPAGQINEPAGPSTE